MRDRQTLERRGEIKTERKREGDRESERERETDRQRLRLQPSVKASDCRHSLAQDSLHPRDYTKGLVSLSLSL